MTPQMNAKAFRIWRYAAARDWNVTYEEIADATGLDLSEVRRVIHGAGFGGKITAARRERGMGFALNQAGHRNRGNTARIETIPVDRLMATSHMFLTAGDYE